MNTTKQSNALLVLGALVGIGLAVAGITSEERGAPLPEDDLFAGLR